MSKKKTKKLLLLDPRKHSDKELADLMWDHLMGPDAPKSAAPPKKRPRGSRKP